MHFQAGDFHHHEKKDTRARGHMLMTSSYCMSSAPSDVYKKRWDLVNPLKKTTSLDWQGFLPTLQTLHNLALLVNPDNIELTPIQIWFELVQRYGVTRLLCSETMSTLAREFKGTLRCVIYGAAVERTVFESIISRVLG